MTRSTIRALNRNLVPNASLTAGSYAVTRGMVFAHMGWIFYKPSYPRMSSIGREDLDRDPSTSNSLARSPGL